MRILLVTPSFPFPLNDGGRIGYYNPIKYLSRRNEMVLVSFARPDEEAHLLELEPFCIGIKTFGRHRAATWALARGLVMDPPGSSAKYWDPAFGDFLADCIATYKPDIVELQHLTMAAYVKYVPTSIPTILREHNVEYKIWDRQSVCAKSWLERAYVRTVAPRVRRYEGFVANQFARCITVSAADARALRAISPRAEIEIIPSGVDTEYFSPLPGIEEEPYSMVHTGSFDWPPKQRSLWILLTEIFPRIKALVPKATLRVVGKGIPDHIRRRAGQIAGVILAGEVEDVRPYVWRSSLVLHYLESGGGIALKVLEALAMRKAVLSNLLGCEGIELESGRDCIVADGPDSFVNAAVDLLHDQRYRQRLADGGHRRILESYAWSQLVYQFECCYAGVLKDAPVSVTL